MWNYRLNLWIVRFGVYIVVEVKVWKIDEEEEIGILKCFKFMKNRSFVFNNFCVQVILELIFFFKGNFVCGFLGGLEEIGDVVSLFLEVICDN